MNVAKFVMSSATDDTSAPESLHDPRRDLLGCLLQLLQA